jgi:thiamin-phosphate kinase
VTTLSSLGERALIQRITARLSVPSWVAVGPGDDAAVMAPVRGTHDVFTTDSIVDTVHFDRRFVPPDAIGHRALAVNLSDLAAMGAQPRAALLSLLLPDSIDLADIDAIVDGMRALADAHRVAIIGGNITRTPGPLVIDVTAIGSVHPRRVLLRSGARPGDEVYVTGTLGDAAVGLNILRSERSDRSDRSDRADRSERSERHGDSNMSNDPNHRNDPNSPNRSNDPNGPNPSNDPNGPNVPNDPNDPCIHRFLRPEPRNDDRRRRGAGVG